MARLIQQELKRPLAEALLFGTLQEGGTAKVTVQDGKLRIDTGGTIILSDGSKSSDYKPPEKPAASAEKPAEKGEEKPEPAKVP
jgi:hypothetical protein